MVKTLQKYFTIPILTVFIFATFFANIVHAQSEDDRLQDYVFTLAEAINDVELVHPEESYKITISKDSQIPIVIDEETSEGYAIINNDKILLNLNNFNVLDEEPIIPENLDDRFQYEMVDSQNIEFTNEALEKIGELLTTKTILLSDHDEEHFFFYFGSSKMLIKKSLISPGNLTLVDDSNEESEEDKQISESEEDKAVQEEDKQTEEKDKQTEEKDSLIVEEESKESETIKSLLPEVNEKDSTTLNSLQATTTSGKYVKINSSKAEVYLNEKASTVVGTVNEGQEFKIIEETPDFIKIQFGNQLGFIRKASITQSDGSSIKNLNTNYTNSSKTFRAINEVIVYDNTSGSLVPMGTIKNNIDYPIVEQTSQDWYRVLLGNRVGYVYRPHIIIKIQEQDKYFQTIYSQTPVVVNRSGGSDVVGYLSGRQEFEILSHIDGFVRIQYSNGIGYVKNSLITASNGYTIKNKNSGYTNSSRFITPIVNVPIYDNSSGKLVSMGTLNKGESYVIVDQSSKDWYRVLFGGRVGYIYKPHVHDPVLSTDKYMTLMYSSVPVVQSNGQVGELKGKGHQFPILSTTSDGFIRIQFGDSVGYVKGSHVSGTQVFVMNDLNPGLANSSKRIKVTKQVNIYSSQSKDSFVTASLNEGVSYPIVQDTSSLWVQVSIGQRLGYVYKADVEYLFDSNDQYFTTARDGVPIHVNGANGDEIVGTLVKGEKYKIFKSISGFVGLKFGDKIGYVRTSEVEPTNGSGLKNIDNGEPLSGNYIQTKVETSVYDNTSGSLVEYAKIKPGQSYPVIRQTSKDWLMVSLGGRIGYVYRPHVKYTSTQYRYIYYDMTLDEMVKKQVNAGAQTDKRYDTYVSKTYINRTSSSSGTVTVDGLNVRGGPGTTYWIVGQLLKGQTIEIYGETNGWLRFRYPKTWKNASPEDVKYYLNPNNFSTASKDYLQFLLLTESMNLDPNEVNNKILTNKGILENKAHAFIEAGRVNHINEIYLISHALLETSNGNSKLATGVLVSSVDGKPVEPKVVYNMYGIGALDSCAVRCGSERAYKEGWFNPEKAIIDGAKWISRGYINNPNYDQNTLYKMRWNPAYAVNNPPTHQYATDIGWAVKQTSRMYELFSLLDNYDMVFDVPQYKK
ncbi:SH3 domain-containing protein [Bacillus aquiflavi]|uniref:SH3 domain-containing protein n=1 Tax=Bacillus aquiflavi TaxID=2672567 RepID=A0A6B3W367_9BACI|nr:SH3 domain-containing protein [Bacillus aquiflavi]MBA4538057.1 SH3 domain-containing protein [Bacillus aquiflavi]NEY82356.1 SH3 domain-containing protein [Bacillus aquiflavi]